MKTYKIEKGTLLHVEGIPVFAGTDCQIEINPSNVRLLSEGMQKAMIEEDAPPPSEQNT